MKVLYSLIFTIGMTCFTSAKFVSLSHGYLKEVKPVSKEKEKIVEEEIIIMKEGLAGDSLEQRIFMDDSLHDFLNSLRDMEKENYSSRKRTRGISDTGVINKRDHIRIYVFNKDPERGKELFVPISFKNPN